MSRTTYCFGRWSVQSEPLGGYHCRRRFGRRHIDVHLLRHAHRYVQPFRLQRKDLQRLLRRRISWQPRLDQMRRRKTIHRSWPAVCCSTRPLQGVDKDRASVGAHRPGVVVRIALQSKPSCRPSSALGRKHDCDACALKPKLNHFTKGKGRLTCALATVANRPP